MNKIDNFFANKSIASFDTETTGLDHKKDNIWQIGFTSSSAEKEAHVNPFLVYDPSTKEYKPKDMPNRVFSYRLRTSNGIFSNSSHSKGLFNNIISLHNKGILSNSLDKTFNKTIASNLKTSDILVLQNHNFENNMFMSSINKGTISKKTIDRLKDKLEYIKESDNGNLERILQVPPKAMEYSRKATFINTIYGLNNTKQISNYKDTMNSVIDSYKEAVTNSSKSVVIEQMDITKALYANAIHQGFMEPAHARVGLSMDFLTRSLLGRSEQHTALSDSKDTVEVFKKTWNMIEELRSGTVSDTTKHTLTSMNNMQKQEVNKQFLSTVSSVIGDFNTKGYTNYSSTDINYAPTSIKNNTTKEVTNVPGFSTSTVNRKEYDFNMAMDEVEKAYSIHGDIDRRKEYIDNIKSDYKIKGSKIVDNRVKTDHFNFKPESIPVDSIIPKQAERVEYKLTNYKKYAAIAGLGLLGTMWLKGSPKDQEQNSYVSEQFYDEEYLGTQFINFDNRNKHYMY